MSWKYKVGCELTSIDDIYERFHHGYYHSISALEEALHTLFLRCQNRCINILAQNYLA